MPTSVYEQGDGRFTALCNCSAFWRVENLTIRQNAEDLVHAHKITTHRRGLRATQPR
jgi:hypothetical protein